MKTLKELRAERAALVKKSRDFLETRATDDVRLSAEDDATYAKMEEALSSIGIEPKVISKFSPSTTLAAVLAI